MDLDSIRKESLERALQYAIAIKTLNAQPGAPLHSGMDGYDPRRRLGLGSRQEPRQILQRLRRNSAQRDKSLEEAAARAQHAKRPDICVRNDPSGVTPLLSSRFDGA